MLKSLLMLKEMAAEVAAAARSSSVFFSGGMAQVGQGELMSTTAPRTTAYVKAHYPVHIAF